MEMLLLLNYHIIDRNRIFTFFFFLFIFYCLSCDVKLHTALVDLANVTEMHSRYSYWSSYRYFILNYIVTSYCWKIKLYICLCLKQVQNMLLRAEFNSILFSGSVRLTYKI